MKEQPKGLFKNKKYWTENRINWFYIVGKNNKYLRNNNKYPKEDSMQAKKQCAISDFKSSSKAWNPSN